MRPWRLTRRARVEMEAALAVIRGEVAARRTPRLRVDAAELLCESPSLLDVSVALRLDEWRILRARVALALRAALRADEDARCEEACERAHWTAEEVFVQCLREWPDPRRWRGQGRVPRALWEVAR